MAGADRPALGTRGGKPPTGRAVHSFFPPAALLVTVRLREKLCGAIPGERVGERVS